MLDAFAHIVIHGANVLVDGAADLARLTENIPIVGEDVGTGLANPYPRTRI